MGPQVTRWCGRYAWLVLLAVLPWLTGCRTTAPLTPFDTSAPGWRVQQGQALWKPRPDVPELAGELVLARHEDGRFLIQFAKTPFALVVAQSTLARWAIEFPPRRVAFAGKGRPPDRFAWLHLPRALRGETLPGPWRFDRKPDHHWRLANTRTGEVLEGYLSP